MNLRQAFAQSLRTLRRCKGVTQEDLAVVSSRTYVSQLERGLKSPTLDMMDRLARAMGVHPLTLVALTYLKGDEGTDLETLLGKVRSEIAACIGKEPP